MQGCMQEKWQGSRKESIKKSSKELGKGVCMKSSKEVGKKVWKKCNKQLGKGVCKKVERN